MTALDGLDPIQKQSGTSVHEKSRISKHTNKMIRRCLYMPTLCSIKYNHKIRVFYERLVSKHKPKKVAVIAAIAKIALNCPCDLQEKDSLCSRVNDKCIKRLNIVFRESWG